MTSKLYSRHGGTPSAVFDDITPITPYFGNNGEPLIQMGSSCQNGAASQGYFRVKDPITNIDLNIYFPFRTLIRWTEDASGDEIWLSSGRISQIDRGRDMVKVDDYIEHFVGVDDANLDIRGLAFTEDWSRPVETDTERLYALQAYILNGTSSTSPTYRPSTTITVDDTHLAPDTNTVTMEARVYRAGTQPHEVIESCAVEAAKIFGVVIHHVGGSHLCLLYIQETDHTTYQSAVKIIDQDNAVDSENLTDPVYPPIWDQGHGMLGSGEAAISGLVSRYETDSFVYVNDPTAEDDYETWIDAYSDAGGPDGSTARANAILLYRYLGNFTMRVTVLVMAEQTALLGAGMSLEIDTAVILGGQYRGEYTRERIVVLNWEPAANGLYWAHMELNRGLHNLPRPGQVQYVLPVTAGG